MRRSCEAKRSTRLNPAKRRGEAPAAQEGARKRPRGASRDLFGQFAPKSIVGQVALLIALAIACLIGVATYQLVGYRDGLWADRRHELTTLVEVRLVDRKRGICRRSVGPGERRSGSSQRGKAARQAALRRGRLRLDQRHAAAHGHASDQAGDERTGSVGLQGSERQEAVRRDGGRRAAVRFGVRRLRLAETRQGQAAAEAVLRRAIQALGLGDRDRRLRRRPRRSLLCETEDGGLAGLPRHRVLRRGVGGDGTQARAADRFHERRHGAARRGRSRPCDRRGDDARPRTRAHVAGAGRVQAERARPGAAGIRGGGDARAHRSRARAGERRARQGGQGADRGGAASRASASRRSPAAI